MFQPHSVRGLLSRRNINRLEAEEQRDTVAGGDPDLQGMVEAKLIIKDIDHQIADIRQWRGHQKSLLEERLACNDAIAKVTVNEYINHLDREGKREEEETKKLMSKLQIAGEEGHAVPAEWNTSDTNLFEFVASSNRMVDERKYEYASEKEATVENHANLINQLQNMSEIMLRRENQPEQVTKKEKTGVDREKLKKELQDIDDQLREIEEMLKD